MGTTAGSVALGAACTAVADCAGTGSCCQAYTSTAAGALILDQLKLASKLDKITLPPLLLQDALLELLLPVCASSLVPPAQLPPVLPPSLFPPLPSPPPSTLCELDQFNIVNNQQ